MPSVALASAVMNDTPGGTGASSSNIGLPIVLIAVVVLIVIAVVFFIRRRR